MTRTSALHTSNVGHRAMILPAPRRKSNTALLAAISDLQTAGALTEYEATRARGRVNREN